MLPEYVYVDNYYDNYKKNRNTELHVAISQWNIFWEAGQLRYDFFQEDLPKSLKWLKKFRNRNIYLLPYTPNNRYYTYEPLFHLLPLKTRKYFKLPLVKEGIWPFTCDFNFYANNLLPSKKKEELEQETAGEQEKEDYEKKHREQLQMIHATTYKGTDDNMPDDYDEFISNSTLEELKKYVEVN